MPVAVLVANPAAAAVAPAAPPDKACAAPWSRQPAVALSIACPTEFAASYAASVGSAKVEAADALAPKAAAAPSDNATRAVAPPIMLIAVVEMPVADPATAASSVVFKADVVIKPVWLSGAKPIDRVMAPAANPVTNDEACPGASFKKARVPAVTRSVINPGLISKLSPMGCLVVGAVPGSASAMLTPPVIFSTLCEPRIP